MAEYTINADLTATKIIKKDGAATEFLMADGSTLNGIKAKATSVAANANPEVTFDNGTFNFKIPSGVNGEKGEKGEKGDTGSVASLTQTEGSVVTSVKLGTDKSLTVTRGNIGGRNLLKSSKKYSMNQWSGDIMNYSEQTDYYQITSKGTDNIAFYVNVLNYLTTKELKTHDVTVSVLVKTDVDDSIKAGIVFQKSPGSTLAMGSYHTTAQYTTVKAGEWTRIYSTFRCEHNLDETFTDSQNQTYKIGSASFIIASNNKTPVKTVYQVKDFKLELGSAPTDWSAAPEDLQTSVTSGEYPLLMKGSYIGEGYYDDAVKLNTSTNTISANISGNAATATKATTASKIQEFNKTDLKSGATKSNPGLLYNKGFALLHDYAGTWENMPSGFNYGHVLNLGCAIGSLDTQLAFGYDVNRSAYIRTADIQPRNIDSTLGIPTVWKDSSNDYGWKRIAWASELSSYLQLSGGTMTGAIKFNRTGDFIWDSSGTTILAIVPDSGGYISATAKQLVLGNTTRETNIRGSASNLKYNNKEVALASDYVKKTGDTMTGNLNITNSSNPALGVGSSAITYNKTTGCLEITA